MPLAVVGRGPEMTSERLLIKVSHKAGATCSATATLGISGPELTVTPLFEVPAAVRTGRTARSSRPVQRRERLGHCASLCLLETVVFYKVGHLGSHKATLKAKGLKLMRTDDFVGSYR